MIVIGACLASGLILGDLNSPFSLTIMAASAFAGPSFIVGAAIVLQRARAGFSGGRIERLQTVAREKTENLDR